MCKDVPIRYAATCTSACYDSTCYGQTNELQYYEFEDAAFLYPASVSRADLFDDSVEYADSYYYYYYSYSVFYASGSYQSLLNDFIQTGEAQPKLYRLV